MRSLVPGLTEYKASAGCVLNAVEEMITTIINKHLADLVRLAPDYILDFGEAADAVLVFGYSMDEGCAALLDHVSDCDYCAPAFAAMVEVALTDVGFLVSSTQEIPVEREEGLLQGLRRCTAELTRKGSRCAVLWIEEHLPEIEEAMQSAEEVGDDRRLISYGRTLHRYYWWRGDVGGMVCLERAVHAAQRSGDIEGQAYLLWAQADLVRRNCEYRRALDLYQQAEALHMHIDNPLGLADCWKGRAEVVRHMDDYPTALRLYDQGLRLYEAAGDRMGVANCIRGKADTYRRMDELRLAISALEDAKWRYEELGVLLGVANCLKGKAEIYRMKGLSSSALSYFEEARRIYELLDAQIGVGHCLRGAGNVYWMQCQYEAAVDSYHQATQIFVSAGLYHPGVARTYLGWAETYSQAEDFVAARDCLVKALREYRVIRSRLGRARCLCVKATILRKELGDVPALRKASRLYRRAHSIFQAIGSRRGMADCLQGLAATERHQGHNTEALAIYVEAKGLYETIEASLGVAICLRGMGKAYLATDRYLEAEHVFEREAEILKDFEGREAEVTVARQQQALARDRWKRSIAQKRLQEIHAHQEYPYW